MLKINRILFLAEPADVRLQPHTEDPTKFVLKSKHPECAAALCKSIGVEPGQQWQGSVYFVTEVDKVAFMEGFAKMALEALQQPQAKALPPKGICTDCGGENGVHWAFCPHHAEQKRLN